MSDNHKFNYHEYYDRPRDHEYVYPVPEQYAGDPPMSVWMSKVGGGTVGERYTGAWAYSVTFRGERLHGDDITSNTPATHEEMVRTLCSFLGAAGESVSMRDRSSEYWDEYTGKEREFLATWYERFQLASLDGEEFGHDE